jgi:hypothetical protein
MVPENAHFPAGAGGKGKKDPEIKRYGDAETTEWSIDDQIIPIQTLLWISLWSFVPFSGRAVRQFYLSWVSRRPISRVEPFPHG